MKELALAYLLPEEFTPYYQSLRLKIAQTFDLPLNESMPAHITLKYPFPNRDTVEVRSTLRDFCRSQTVAQWRLRDFGHFINPGQYVVFIDADPDAGALQAHAALLDRLRSIPWISSGPFDGANAHHHITLATHGITSLNFDAILRFLNQQEKPDFEINFDHIALVGLDGDWFEITDIYPFQG